MPVFLLALSQIKAFNTTDTILVFGIIHFLVYPASNGYNSYIDRDKSPIGGLENPPEPTKQLFYFTLFLDVMAVLLAFWFINPLFSACVFIYILASRAYSAKQIRLKKNALAGFLTVVFFQGAFTYFMCCIGLSNQPFVFNYQNTLILLAASLQIAGAYPLTQIYQHQEDYAEGIISLSYRLGYKGTFIFTLLMFVLCTVFYFLYFKTIEKAEHFYILQLFFFPIVVYFLYWFYKVVKNEGEANFKNTMRMNTIAACCMNACFLFLFYLNN